jgi:chorismate dehydratase
MIRLGHIEYSNCFPVHALLVEQPVPEIDVVSGTPAELNHALETRAIDVAPSSSIEYARHGEYRLLRDFVIGSNGPIGSILFESKIPISEHGNMGAWEHATVAVPTASATSVVLLKILLKLRYGVHPGFTWFSQEAPAPDDADGALWIGDVALRRSFAPDRYVYDLGAEWQKWTGLPFAFAAWQTALPESRDADLHALSAHLRKSRDYFLANADRLAEAHAGQFGIDAERLLNYWQSLQYNFDETMQQGLQKFFELAAQVSEAPQVHQLRFV